MTARIKDLVDVVAAGARATGGDAGPSALATFLMSYEIRDALARTVERLVSAEPGPHNCLVVGGPGCGKSRLLEAVGALLEAPAAAPMRPRMAEIRASIGLGEVVVVRIPPPDDERRLAAVLERAALDRLSAAGHPCPDDGDAPGVRLERLASALGGLPENARLVVVLDNVDRWLDAAARYALENAQTLKRLGELSRLLPIAVCAAAGEYVLTHETGSGGQGWVAGLLDTYRIEYVSARALRTATASNVLVKNARQRHEIGDVLALLREKLPQLGCGEEEFVELYPLEVSTWTVGSHLHRWIRGFSFPEFAERAAESVKRRPAPSLFALNDMFALYEPQLRHVGALAPSFAAYDLLVAEALPRLGSQQRLWGRLALQSIFMHTLAGIAADVTTIANSVLLYDLHSGGSSYAMMAAVLKQLETLDRGQLVASGDGAGRRYSLVTGQREALLVLVDEMADAIDEDEAVSAMLGVGGHVFADWPFATSGPASGRLDLWEIDQGEGRITIEARGLEGRDTGDLAERPRLVLFSPGRTWSEASEEARRRAATACWVGAMPTPAERATMRRWLAASRLDADKHGQRYADLPAVLEDLEAQTVEIFRRVYVDGGMRVAADRSDGIADFVGETRDENLVVRLLPVPLQPGVPQRPSGELKREGVWIAHLLSEDRLSVDAMAAWLDADGWLQRLEAWYGARVARDDAAPVRMLGERCAGIPEIVEALDAKQLFDAALYYVRRALASHTPRGLGEAISKVFDTPDRIWETRERIAWLDGFADWTRTLDRVVVYLRDAEAVAETAIESQRASLLAWADRTEDFVGERGRAAFLDAFAAYRQEYAAFYAREHDAFVGGDTIDRLCTGLVEGPAWCTLEALSSLSIGSPAFLVDAINLVSELRAANCAVDVCAALAEDPVCACRFRFADPDRLAAVAARAHAFVDAGIEYHRRLLQERREELREKVTARKSAYDPDTIRTIAELTKEGPAPQVDMRTVEAINELLARDGSWYDGDDKSRSLASRTVNGER